MSILLPLYVISGNEKMKKDFMDGWINLKMDLLEIFLACFKAKLENGGAEFCWEEKLRSDCHHRLSLGPPHHLPKT